MNQNQLILAIIFCPILFFSSTLSAQNRADEIVKILDLHVIPMKTINPDSSFEDIHFLKDVLKDKQIIGLGEGTHGTYEFFRYKDRLSRFLVTELGFKAIAFESDYAAVLRLDEYVNGLTDTIEFLGGFPLNGATKEMLEWLRIYNKNLTLSEKVHLYGLEMRGFSNISRLLLDSLVMLSASDREALQKLQLTPHHLLTRKDIAEIESRIPSIYAAVSSNEPYTSGRRHVRLLEQGIKHYLQTSRRQLGMRDKYMFEIAVGIKEETDNQKLIIWAHNGHLSKENIYSQAPLGKYLFEKYGPHYYSVATDFNHGAVSVFVNENGTFKPRNIYYHPISSSKGFEYYFGQAKYSNFLLDVNTAVKNPVLKSFLDGPRMMRSIGGTEKPSESMLSVSKSFDMVVFFDQTKPNR